MSLMDLTITMLVMGVLAGVGGLRYADAVANHRLDSAALRTAALFDSARRVARAQNDKVKFTVEVNNNRIKVDGMPHPDHPKTTNYNIPFTDYGSGISLTAETFSPNDFQFNNLGMVNRGGTLTISNGSRTKVVSVAAGTGEVTVQ
jgi:Tfp pilus assembly protein FimT